MFCVGILFFCFRCFRVSSFICSQQIPKPTWLWPHWPHLTPPCLHLLLTRATASTASSPGSVKSGLPSATCALALLLICHFSLITIHSQQTIISQTTPLRN
jgi:hypothetical protein